MDARKKIFISCVLRPAFLEPRNTDRARGIFGKPGMSVLRPCTRIALKKALSHTLALGWALDNPPPNECPGNDTKQSDGEVPAMLELWGMRSTPSVPSLPGPLWPGVVEPDRALSMD